MSELRDVYEKLLQEMDPDYVPDAELTCEERLARGAKYVAKALYGKFAPDFHVGWEFGGDEATGSYGVFIPSRIGWRLRKGRGIVNDPRLGGLDTTMAKVAMLTENGQLLHVTYDPTVTETARDVGRIRAIPAGDVAMTDVVADMLSTDADMSTVFMFDNHARRVPYGLEEVTFDLARFALRHGVPVGM